MRRRLGVTVLFVFLVVTIWPGLVPGKPADAEPYSRGEGQWIATVEPAELHSVTSTLELLDSLSNIDHISQFGGAARVAELRFEGVGSEDVLEIDSNLDWTQVGTQNSPPARYIHGMAYDSTRGVIVLVGGEGQSCCLRDTWEFDGHNWRQVDTPTPLLINIDQALVYDAYRQKTVLFGGQAYSGSGYSSTTYEFDGADWVTVDTNTRPLGRNAHAMVYHSALQHTVLFGGFGDDSLLNDTWVYGEQGWSQIDTPAAPSPRYHHSMAYDSSRNLVILFGGNEDREGRDNLLADTWEFDGLTWRQATPNQSPPARENHSTTFDSARGVVVLFGGEDKNGVLNDTWEYDGHTWTQIVTGSSPAPRGETNLVFDTKRKTTYLFGGGKSILPKLRFGDTWAYRSWIPDYTITAIEVTQAIQDLENTVPLIAGKKTYARVHVENVGTSSNVPITAQLCLGNDCRRPDNKHGALPSGYLQIPANPDRGRLNDSFYFQLPAHWVTEGANLALTANVNPDRFSEVSFSNNTYSLAAEDEVPEIRPSYPLNVRLYDIRYTMGHIDGDHEYSVGGTRNDLEMIRNWLSRAYPISIDDLTVDPDSLEIDEPLEYFAPWFWLDLLNSKRVLDSLSSLDNANNSIYYGVVIDGDYTPGTTRPGASVRGQARPESNSAVGPTGRPGRYKTGERITWDTDGSYGDWMAGHEIGHILIDHSKPDAPQKDHIFSEDDGCDQSSLFRETTGNYYKYPNGRIGGEAPHEEDRFYGFDTNYPADSVGVRIYPSSWHDIMTYCPDLWISDTNYLAIYETIKERHNMTSSVESQSSFLRNVDSEIGYVVVHAVVNITQDTAKFDHSFRLTSAAAIDLPNTSNYAITFKDGYLNPIATFPVVVSNADHADGSEDEVSLLHTVLPWVGGTKHITLEYNGQTLATQDVSTVTPEVTVTQPNGGEVVANTLEVAWTASDADGDPLEYIVQYSADSGQSWDTVSVGITNTQSIELDTTYLPGSDNALVRVLASDGVNTGVDQSDQPFSVDHKIPEAVISAPANGAVFADGQTIGLFGDAYDVEDGYLQGNSIQWSSDMAGPLGVGQSTYPEDMPLGVHQITMTATDSDGNVSTDTITITIEEAPQPPATPSQAVPGNGQSDVPVDIILSWTGGDANTGDNVTYDVYFGTTSSPPLEASGQSAKTYNPPGDLLYATTYYWQIIATDSTGLVAEGPVWSFTTAGVAPTPTPTATSTATSTPSPTPTTTPTATPSPTATPPPVDQSVTVNPTADTYTNSGYPTRNYGNASTLNVKDASRDMTAYLQFDTSLNCVVITRATLRLYVTDSSNDGGDVYAVDSNWTEKALTAANAPALPAQSLASAGPVSVGQWIELDVTAGVSGSAAFAIMNGTSDIVKYSSREGAHPPELVVEYQEQTGAAPVAAFSFSPSNPIAGQQVQFTDQSTGCPSSWSWDFDTGSSSAEASPTHTFTVPGDYNVSLTVSNANGSSTITHNISVLEVPEGETLYFSPQQSGSVGGVSFTPADIVGYDTGSQTWSMFFDASDVGVSGNVNAFAFENGGKILLAFKSNQSLSGLGTATPQDIVRYLPDTGLFEWVLDGSNVGLSGSAERIDALAIDPATGRLLLSTMGTAKVSGSGGTLTSHDEDVLAYDLGAQQWSLFFDGTPVGGLQGEDINGIWVDPATGDLYLVILGGFNLGGVRGNGRDVVRFEPNGNSYDPVEIYWDGSAKGFPTNVDGLEIVR